jgi:lipoyl(octanoyl) transferase
MKKNEVLVHDLGHIAYQEAHDIQQSIFDKSIALKVANRNLLPENQTPTENHLLFCEHPPVYTLGRSGDQNNMLLNDAMLVEKGAEFHAIGRGGDITFHGPGQLVGYPIFDLDLFFTDIHKYLRYLEEAIILTLADFGLSAGRIDGLTGVWIDYEKQINPRKICALGVKASRWITMHGFALNVNTNLDFFDHIVPCGIKDKAVTSIQKELNKEIDIKDVQAKVLLHLSQLFDFNPINYEKGH